MWDCISRKCVSVYFCFYIWIIHLCFRLGVDEYFNLLVYWWNGLCFCATDNKAAVLVVLSAQTGVVKDAIEEIEQVHTQKHTRTHTVNLDRYTEYFTLRPGVGRGRRPVQWHPWWWPGRGGASGQPGHLLVREGPQRDWSVPGADESVSSVSEEADVSCQSQRWRQHVSEPGSARRPRWHHPRDQPLVGTHWHFLI